MSARRGFRRAAILVLAFLVAACEAKDEAADPGGTDLAAEEGDAAVADPGGPDEAPGDIGTATDEAPAGDVPAEVPADVPIVPQPDVPVILPDLPPPPDEGIDAGSDGGPVEDTGPAPEACDTVGKLLLDEGCWPGRTCTIVYGSQWGMPTVKTGCRDVGTTPMWETCAGSDQCVAGTYCETVNGWRGCYPFCGLGKPCPEGSACTFQTDKTGIKLCTRN